jgi:hypothetical protein
MIASLARLGGPVLPLGTLDNFTDAPRANKLHIEHYPIFDRNESRAADVIGYFPNKNPSTVSA